MSLAEEVYQTVVQEVLDFALFLQQREEALEWHNLNACSNQLICRLG